MSPEPAPDANAIIKAGRALRNLGPTNAFIVAALIALLIGGFETGFKTNGSGTGGVTTPPSTLPTPITTAPSPSTTIPSTTTSSTTLPPPTTGKPSLTNTGVPAGVALTTVAGFTASTPGQVFDRLDVNGCVDVTADNVTIMRSRVRCSSFYVIRTADCEPGTGVNSVPCDPVTGTKVTDSDVDGLGTGEGSNCIAGGATTVLRAHVHGCENDVTPQSDNWKVLDSLLDGLKAPGAPHYDAVQLDGGPSHIVIRHNTIINDYGQTAAVMIDNYFGASDDITVDDNWLKGGGYTVYCDAQFSSTRKLTNIRITNNRVQPGFWGPFDFNQCTPVNSGNVIGPWN